MKVPIKNLQGDDAGEVEVTFPVIENGKGTQAVHDTVVAYLANRRRGTACTKTRGEVAGGGRKPWRQKGTGRARHGSIRSPIWVGGGVVFGPRPRDFSKKVNHKVKQLALRKALSERLKAGEVLIVEEFTLNAPKTREFVRTLAALQVEGSVLIVTAEADPTLVRASRNVPGVEVTPSASLNTYQVLRYDKLVFTREAFSRVEARLS